MCGSREQERVEVLFSPVFDTPMACMSLFLHVERYSLCLSDPQIEDYGTTARLGFCDDNTVHPGVGQCSRQFLSHLLQRF